MVDGVKRDMEADNPVTRIEALLTSIATNSAAMRRAYDTIYAMEWILEDAVERQKDILRRLDEFDDKYVASLKSGPRHGVFMRTLRDVRNVLQYGRKGKDCEDPLSIAAVLRKIGRLHGEIRGTQLMQSGSEFVKPVCSDIAALREIYKDVHKLLVKPLPRMAEPVAQGTLADNDGWAALLLRLSRMPGPARLGAVAEAMSVAAEDMESIVRKTEKLAELSGGRGSTASERSAAARRTQALQTSLDTLRLRMVALSSSFYSRRKRAMAAIADATRRFNRAMGSPGVTIDTIRAVKEFRNRHGIRHDADDLVSLDEALDRGKGRNPTLGSLMRFYHDNAQRRISNG